MAGMETFKTALLAALIATAVLVAHGGRDTVETQPLPMPARIVVTEIMVG